MGGELLRIEQSSNKKQYTIMDRNIIHIDVSSFAVSVERLKNSKLLKYPVIVAFQGMERSVVYATSQEARQAGIYRGMPLQLARKLCRNIVVVPPDYTLYRRAMQAIMKILALFTPTVEPVGYGHAYLDMTGTTRLFGATKDAGSKIQREIQSQLRLQSTLGIAGNKLVSKIASAVIKPVGLQDIMHGTEEKFIGPLTVNYLPNINYKIKQQLLDFNIQIIRQIAETPIPLLTTAFGKTGLRLHEAAHGIDKTPVRPFQKIPTVAEEQTLAEDSNDYLCLRGVLYHLMEKAAFRLRSTKRAAKKISLEILYSDHKKAFGQQTLDEPSNLEKELFLFGELVLKKILTRRTRVRKISLCFLQLAPASRQMSLFSTNSDVKVNSLTEAVDKIREKFGGDAIQLALHFQN